MQRVFFDDSCLKDWIDAHEFDNYREAAALAEKHLQEKSGAGNDFLGWLDLPERMLGQVDKIKAKADEIRANSDVLVCIGIGGSYLGSKAAIEFMAPAFEAQRKPLVVFCGHQVNSDAVNDLLDFIKDKEVSVNVISKSGTTTEPGIAFRIIREFMEKKYGRQGAAARIVATTDPASGALRKLATAEGYATFPIPEDVGGRFSVLTAVGLLPIAVAGVNIRELVQGAVDAHAFCSSGDIGKNIAARYAVARNILFRQGKGIEVLSNFQPQLHFVGEWWKQLAGESEGKDQTGIFPACLDFTTDLHSLGQWMQEGQRTVFETFMIFKKTKTSLAIPSFADDGDGLNYLAGKDFEFVNDKAFKGTLLAHLDGGVPCSVITLEDRSAATLGQLFYFFEKTIAISGYLLRVNPFDQPGVEAYKKNMFALLGKAGNEKQGEVLKERLRAVGL